MGDGILHESPCVNNATVGPLVSGDCCAFSKIPEWRIDQGAEPGWIDSAAFIVGNDRR